MGWTFQHRDKGVSHKQFFGHLFTFETEAKSQRMLDCAAKLDTVYCAIEYTYKATGKRAVSAAICLIRWRRNDWYNFGYKGMDEGMGPNEAHCPRRILDLLTPVEDTYDYESGIKYANEWRAKCRANLARNAARPRLSVGKIIRTPAPIRFQNGIEEDTFVVRIPKRMLVTDLRGYRFRLNRESLDGAQTVTIKSQVPAEGAWAPFEFAVTLSDDSVHKARVGVLETVPGWQA